MTSHTQTHCGDRIERRWKYNFQPAMEPIARSPQMADIVLENMHERKQYTYIHML